VVNIINKIRGALSKLTITAYKDNKLTAQVGHLEAMYNPEGLSLDYATRYDEKSALNEVSDTNVFVGSNPGRLEVQLIFDGTLPTHWEPVDQQLNQLRSLCGVVDGTSRQTRYLKIVWGNFSWHGDGYFACRMERLSIRYTLFDRDGSPLRATATLSVVEDRDPSIQHTKLGLNRSTSPVVQMLAGTGLPLMAAAQSAVVGAVMAEKPAVDYLKLAKANDLDHLDDVTPGQELNWPASEGAIS